MARAGPATEEGRQSAHEDDEEGDQDGDVEAPAPPQEEEESVHYLWGRAPPPDTRAPATTTAATTTTTTTATTTPAAAADAALPRQHVEFDPWRIEAERERERRERQHRAPLSRRALVRLLLWAHASMAVLASCVGAAALLLTTGRLLLRGGQTTGGDLSCYSSVDVASLTVCEVATGLGALSALAWPAFVAHFLAESATAGNLPCGAVRPRYGQMAFEGVMGLAWGAVAAGAVVRRPEADAGGTPRAAARGALAGLAVAAALLFLLMAACDAALVFLLTVGYDSGALRREGGIFGVMFSAPSPFGGGGGRRRRGGGGEGGAAAGEAGAPGAAEGAAAAATDTPSPVEARKAPPGLRWVVWAPGGGAARPRPQSAGSTFEMY